MKVEEVLHMVGGYGETSYANNSKLQEKAIFEIKPLVEKAIKEICSTLLPEKFVAVDLGCSSGPNALLVLSTITNSIDEFYNRLNQHKPEIQFFLNDLPGNDFNNIFHLSTLYQERVKQEKGNTFVSFYIAGLPGSFYGRLFPLKSVHFFHSSYCLMWLSQVPEGLKGETCAQLNKGNIYINEDSSSIVSHLYFEQFKRDFSLFLKSRSHELIVGGKMILSFLGRANTPFYIGGFMHFWGFLSEALNAMVSEAKVSCEERLTMKIDEIFHMVGGYGDASYANNSKIPEKATYETKPLVEKAISEICNTLLPEKFVGADLGCSSGPNALLVISTITNSIDELYNRLNQHKPEIQFFLNDLPGNDFNNIFQLSMLYHERVKQEKGDTFVSFYIAGLPGSFYGRLFPLKSVHFFHSSYSLMWLSQVPKGLVGETCAQLNKGNIYINEEGSTIVSHLYLEQFKRDFSLFLKYRSNELICGGSMILIILGRANAPSYIGGTMHLWGLLSEALKAMVSEGLVEEAKLNSFNLPFYTPSMEELKSIIQMEGSFQCIQAQTFESNWDPFDESIDDFTADKDLSGGNVAKYIRAVVEPLLASHFGSEIIKDLFSHFAKNVARHMSRGKPKHFVLVIFLKLNDEIPKRNTMESIVGVD